MNERRNESKSPMEVENYNQLLLGLSLTATMTGVVLWFILVDNIIGPLWPLYGMLIVEFVIIVIFYVMSAPLSKPRNLVFRIGIPILSSIVIFLLALFAGHSLAYSIWNCVFVFIWVLLLTLRERSREELIY